MKLILLSAFARAQSLYPVKVSHALIEANHLHMILVVENPDDIPGFMRCIKTESSHAINKLLGRSKRTVWCEGYDSPVLLTPASVKAKIVYLYSNPAKDNLVDSIEMYPGVSSWGVFTGKESSRIETCRLRRPEIPCLNDMGNRSFKSIAEELKAAAKQKQVFEFEPDAWMDCFNLKDESERSKINQDIKESLRLVEEEYRKIRKSENKSVIGAEKLANSPMILDYKSQRSGKRMYCISDDPHLRKSFIHHVKLLIAKAREVFEGWKKGDYSVPYPLGLFPPSFPKVCEPFNSEGFALA